MNRLNAILLLLAVSIAPGFADSISDARDILDRYTRAERPAGLSKTDAFDRAAVDLEYRARLTRESILAEWQAMPAEAVAVAGPFLFDKASAVQRYEIVSALGKDIHTRECAELLHRVLLDVRQPKEEDAATYEELTRIEAVYGLDAMARTVTPLRNGQVQRGPVFAPEVPGLTPYLVAASADKSVRVQVAALGALADCGDSVAVAALQKHLLDQNKTVVFHAACLLTEFQDKFGLPQLLARLGELRKADPQTEPGFYEDAGLLFASFERCTGKNFGKTPMLPMLYSSTTGAAGAAQDYQDLLNAWDGWWKTHPAVNDVRSP